MRLRRLIEALHERAGERVVVLVDEYDKPILNALEGPARAADERAGAPVAADPQATANRDDLRGLYGTLKDCDAHIERTFPTGVSKFSKVSLFSDPNFLTDLTLDPRYAAVCGYTEADLDSEERFYVLPSFAKSPRAVADWFDDSSDGALTGRTERVLQIADGRWTHTGFEVARRGRVA